MSRRRPALLVCALLLLGGGDAVDRAREALDALQRRYEGVEDLRARFVQTSHVVAEGRDEVSRGILRVRRPGRMRWEYEEPERRVIVLTRDALQIYVPSEKQLQIAPVESGAVSPTALSFLLGEGDLGRMLDVTGPLESREGEIGLNLRPKQDSGFASLQLWLDPETYQLRESVVVDLFGNRTRVRFDRIVENTGIAEGNFSITVPDDTEVIDLR